MSAVSGCSSMAQIHPQSRYKNILRTWGLKCDEAFEKRIVPSITLEQVLPNPTLTVITMALILALNLP